MRLTGLLSDILRDNRFTEKNFPELEAKLFFEGKRCRPYLVRFVVLLFLLTVIATFPMLDRVNSALEEALLANGITIAFTTYNVRLQGSDQHEKSSLRQDGRQDSG